MPWSCSVILTHAITHCCFAPSVKRAETALPFSGRRHPQNCTAVITTSSFICSLTTPKGQRPFTVLSSSSHPFCLHECVFNELPTAQIPLIKVHCAALPLLLKAGGCVVKIRYKKEVRFLFLGLRFQLAKKEPRSKLPAGLILKGPEGALPRLIEAARVPPCALLGGSWPPAEVDGGPMGSAMLVIVPGWRMLVDVGPPLPGLCRTHRHFQKPSHVFKA